MLNFNIIHSKKNFKTSNSLKLKTKKSTQNKPINHFEIKKMNAKLSSFFLALVVLSLCLCKSYKLYNFATIVNIILLQEFSYKLIQNLFSTCIKWLSSWTTVRTFKVSTKYFRCDS